MKSFSKATLLSVGLVAMLARALPAQGEANELIVKAMRDELQRNISQLTLEKYKPPFFLAYQFVDVHTLNIRAALGELRQAQENPVRTDFVRLMVGDYALNDENFVGGRGGLFAGGSGALPVPLENDYAAIRRAFWIQTDRIYKSALEEYDQKLTALKQQNKSESEKMDDYSRIVPTNLVVKGPSFVFDKPRWEKVARDVSGLFRSCDQIMSSSVVIAFADATVYLVSNEGTQVRFPVSVACLWVNVFTQAEDGEPLTDHLTYCAPTPAQLPPVDQIKADAQGLADFIVALRKAPVLADSYSGPVIFEGSAVAAVMAEKLFDEEGLIASREPVYAVENAGQQGNMNRLESKINQRICSNKLTIKAVPKMKSFNNIPLVGSFEVDAEGVVPKDELVLVEQGILRTLLNDRVPTLKVKQSNGHSRPVLSRGGYFTAQKAPGVIEVTYAGGLPMSSFRKEILREAADNGLSSIYLVRKLQQQNPGMNREMYYAAARSAALSQPVGLYRLNVKTGEEQLVRSAAFSDFPITTFKRLTQGSKDQRVDNTLLSNSGMDVPVSFIVPQGLVFDDVSLEKVKITKPKLRLVPNPVLAEK
ncbi:MAG: metallopeptidase TldD-related protein [Verrucomicrobia bacterium]|nr:metallopeptidase TldD-related protein [Verrucomicrobiota bacterium]